MIIPAKISELTGRVSTESTTSLRREIHKIMCENDLSLVDLSPLKRRGGFAAGNRDSLHLAGEMKRGETR